MALHNTRSYRRPSKPFDLEMKMPLDSDKAGSRDGVLIILHSPDIDLAGAITGYSAFNVYVATYDLEVYDKYSINGNIREAVFLESPISYNEVAPSVVNVIKKLNLFLRENFDEDLCFFPKHVEGGEMSQRIQDALIFERSFESIVQDFNIKRVINYWSSEWWYENTLLERIAKSLNLEYSVKRRNPAKNFLASFSRKFRIYFNNVYQLARWMLSGFNRQHPDFSLGEGYLALSLHSSAMKHVNNYLAFARSIEKDSRFKCCFVTYGIDSSAIVREFPRVYSLDRHVKIRDYLRASLESMKCIIRYLGVKKHLIEEMKGYSGILQKQLSDSLFYLFFVEMPKRFVYKRALERFARSNSPAGFKLWGGVSLPEGMIANKVMHESGSKARTFHFDVGMSIRDYPYVPENINDVDFFIVSSQMEREIFMSNGIDASRIILVGGSTFLSNARRHGESFSKRQSLDAIGLKEDFDRTILIDVQPPLRGYIHHSEIAQLLLFVKNTSTKYPRYAFILKPHPNFTDILYLEQLFINRKNVFVYDPTLPILHFINAADLIVTKFSTIGIEAIMLDKLVISLSLNPGEEWNVYGGGALYIHSLAELDQLLAAPDEYETRVSQARDELKRELSGSYQNNVDALVERLKVDLAVSEKAAA